MNPETLIRFEEDLPVRISAYSVKNWPLHSHPNSMQIIYVARGTVDVKVSFEHFCLMAGDFIVVNHDDFHYIKSEDGDNVIISINFDISYYQKLISHSRYIVFACHSVNVPDFRFNELAAIRRLIAEMADLQMQGPDGWKAGISEKAEEIIGILNDHFTMMMSTQDSLNATRCFKSERLLLLTRKSIQEISAECGFSDTKYYYKHFKLWFRCTPKQYRELYQPEIHKAEDMRALQLSEAVAALAGAEDKTVSDGASEQGTSEESVAVATAPMPFAGPAELNIIFHDPQDREAASKLSKRLQTLYPGVRVGVYESTKK